MSEMENETIVFHFNLTMFADIGYYRYPAFVLCLLLFALIVFANLVIILIISRERALHEPMYIFIAFLSVNSLYGSSGFFPRFLMDLLADTHLIARPACFTQIYIICTYASYEMMILGIMAYDRYVAVCHPLHYHSKMTSKTLWGLTAFAWLCPAFSLGMCLYLTIRLPLCGNNLVKVYCALWNITKLSCVYTLINNIFGFLVTTNMLIIPLVYVLYTYFQIILVCRRSSSEFKSKAFKTCLPHTISFVSYSLCLFFDVALSRVNVEKLNPLLAVIFSLEFVIVPPILNPFVYGLRLPEIRKHIVSVTLLNST
ncbi:putative gustatory receptor clone PTE03 [Dicentrarchus labrax]|uniref:Olfactory receptor n=1 Tax=Dicentrarchus labrax TaxID=13489 RepID=A0A8P4GHF3_DICLA|nr:putative gustatory receptor clone PTE03 [Dicentrarchus labrax]